MNGEIGGGESHDKEEARTSWSGICSKETKHNESAKWINDIKEELSSPKQDAIVITSNYRPITCLPLIWKLLTGLIAEEMYEFLEEKIYCHENRKVDERNAEELLTSCILTRWY